MPDSRHPAPRALPMLVLLAALLASCVTGPSARGVPVSTADPGSPQAIQAAMQRATRFMVEEVSNEGGYVWSYLPDFSRRWGELEATPTMIWVQPPGTATMGHVFVDARHATGDDSYYNAAVAATDALLQGEEASGGWNYFIDLAGKDAAARWYATVGRNAWRLEEFHYQWDNATFDDAGTSETMQLLLRMAEIDRDPRYLAAARRSLDFVLASQYDNGGWPQRWPVQEPVGNVHQLDYTRHITFNDDVARLNIEFLELAYRLLGDARIPPAIERAMQVHLLTQQPAPQAGRGLQHAGEDLSPAAARSYEPRALVPAATAATAATAANVQALMDFHRRTGDRRFLARIPEALAWLESVRLPEEGVEDGHRFPTFVEIGSNRPLYVHRHGSNVANGGYTVDDDPANPIAHYRPTRSIDLASLRAEYEALASAPVRTRNEASLQRGPLPRFFVEADSPVSDLNLDHHARAVAEIVQGLNDRGYWPTPLVAISHPYRGRGPDTPVEGDFGGTRVGDYSDTSPYLVEDPVIGISTGTYIRNMATLIQALRQGH